MLTVQKAMTIEPISFGKIVAGTQGLNNRITSASVLEIPHDDKFLEKDLLALTSFFSISNDLPKQIEVIKMLAKHDTAALLVFNVGRFGSLPYLQQELINLCDSLRLPLIVMPDNISYYSVLKVVIDHLLCNRITLLENSITLYEAHISQILNEENDYSGLLDTLASIIDREIILFNHNHRNIYFTGHVGDALEAHQPLLSHIEDNLTYGVSTLSNEYTIDYKGQTHKVFPLLHKCYYYGSFVILDISKVPIDAFELAIDQTRRALCISLLGFERMDKYLARMKYNFLLDLILGFTTDRSLVLAQASKLDLDLERISQLAVIQIFPLQTMDDDKVSREANRIISTLECALEGVTAFFIEDERRIVVMTQNQLPADNSMLISVTDKIIAQAPAKYFRLIIGISPHFSDIAKIHGSYLQTIEAIEISSRWRNYSHRITRSDIELFALMNSQINSSEMGIVIDRLLAPVQEYDRRHGTNLEQTFSKLLNYNLSTAETASQLFIHRNTVLQRKKTIEGLYEKNPFSHEERLKYQLAFFFQKLYSKNRASEA